jgi:SRSO17 transposase
MSAMDGDWRVDLERWLAPYLEGLGHKARQRMCPAYVAGLIGPGDRKSIQPMAARTGEVGYDRLHHFIGAGLWDSGPLEATLWEQADALVGGDKAWLIIDDTALPKKGTASVGVAPQYASALGKNANCQTLVSVTLASREVPIMLGLRLFLPESWTSAWSRRACPSPSARIAPSRRSLSRKSTGSLPPGCALAVCSRMPDTASRLLSARG